jgi:hypothetical protein
MNAIIVNLDALMISFSYLFYRCLRYMSEYSNCLMDGYGVLPSSPTKVRVSNVNEDFAIVHWSPPSSLTHTVTGYNIHYRPLGTYENLYVHINNIHAPYILENLYANSEYEVSFHDYFLLLSDK